MKREVELAKQLLESKGYDVSKLNEDGITTPDMLEKRARERQGLPEEEAPESLAGMVRQILIGRHIPYDTIREEDGVVYVDSEKGFSPQHLKGVYYDLNYVESTGFDGRNTMWFDFGDDMSESKEINESYLEYFNHLLHKANNTTLDHLKSIGQSLDIDVDVQPSEEDARKILARYLSKSDYDKIGESKKMNESAESHEGWEYWEMPKDYHGPWSATSYMKEYNDELYLTIYPPQAVPGEDYLDEWHAEIQGINHGTSIDSYETGFKSFKEAEDWINTQLEKYDPEGDKNASDEKIIQNAIDSLEKAIASVPAELMDAFKDQAIRILQSHK